MITMPGQPRVHAMSDDTKTVKCDLLRMVPQDAHARELQDRTDGWIIWYGHATARYWAMPRPPYPWWGLVEGDTPERLTARLTRVEANYGRQAAW